MNVLDTLVPTRVGLRGMNAQHDDTKLSSRHGQLNESILGRYVDVDPNQPSSFFNHSYLLFNDSSNENKSDRLFGYGSCWSILMWLRSICADILI
jgi:hypothetical protein